MAVVFAMSLFTKIYSKKPVASNNSDTRNRLRMGQVPTKSLVDYASGYFMYVLNIMTSQGKMRSVI